MEDLDLAENIETDNIKWPDSKEIILSPRDYELENCAFEDDADTESTVSVNDVEDISPQHLESKVGQLNISSCPVVNVGNQAYYHGDVTIQQYVLSSKDAQKALPSDLKGQVTFIGAVNKEENKNLKNIVSSVKRRHLLFIFIVILVLIGMAVTLILLLPTNEENDEELSSNYTNRLVTRGYWFALPEKDGVTKFEHQPLDIVIVGHTAGSSCSLTTACSSLVRTLQANAFSRQWYDIAYNFLVGGDGYIYEGRGWNKVASHTASYNAISIGVAFIGNFARDVPPKKQLAAFEILLSEGVKLGKINPNYKLFLQREIRPTERPGAALSNLLMKCVHWSPHAPVIVKEWDPEMNAYATFLLYSRQDWYAEPPRGKVEDLKVNPPPYVIIADTAGSNCTSFTTCSQKVHDIQIDHLERGGSDMGMHFLVGGDGAVYTGLGWGKFGSHTLTFNRRSIAIYFIGTFVTILPPQRQIRAAKLLIEEGVKLGKIAPDYKLFAQKQVMATESPGAALIEDLRKWPHWSTYEKSDELKL
nr:PGRPLCLAe [Rhodnius prolixus]